MKRPSGKWFLILGLALGLSGLVTSSARADDKLRLYNWNNYIAPETIARFEKACQCQVVQSYYGDNEEMLAKLAAGAKGYDMVVPTGFALTPLIRQKALMPLDKSRLANLKNLSPAYLKTQFDPDNTYSVPYAYTTTILGYNDEQMKKLGIKVDSWSAIFDPAILSKIKGRVTVLDSANELMAAALKYLGYSANDTDEAHWRKAAEVITKAKPYWAAFNGTSYIKELTVGNIWLVHGYSNDLYQAELDAHQAGRPFHIVQVVPKEGATLSLDSMVILKEAPRPDLALQFINFMLDGKNGSELSNLIGSGTPNQAAETFVQPALKKINGIYPDPDTLKRLEMLHDLTSQQRRLMNRLWTQIRAS